MKIFNFLFILSLFVSSTLCSQTKEEENATDHHKGWESLIEQNYSIKYPDNWELNRTGIMGTAFFLFSPIASEEDRFKENVNLIIEDLTGLGLNLEKYTEFSIKQLSSLITDGTLLENKTITDRKLNYQKVIYSGTQGVFNLKWEMYCWVYKEKAYILTFTCEENEFSNYQDVGEKILNSFQIVKN